MEFDINALTDDVPSAPQAEVKDLHTVILTGDASAGTVVIEVKSKQGFAPVDGGTFDFSVASAVAKSFNISNLTSVRVTRSGYTGTTCWLEIV